LDLAEPLTGDLVKAYKHLAKVNDVWLSFGGIHESILDKVKSVNFISFFFVITKFKILGQRKNQQNLQYPHSHKQRRRIGGKIPKTAYV
jgi:hypothetical protein